MKQARALATVALFATAALIVVAGLVAALLVVLEILSPSELWGVSGAFRAGFYASLVLGVVPSLVLGAPAYWLLWRVGRATWFTVLLLGAVLGALVAVLERDLMPWGVACGILVSGLTHIAGTRWLGPNNSSKPTPLRGAA